MMKRFLNSILAIVAGYSLMVVLITLVQEGMFGGVSWDGTPFPALAAAGFVTCVAGAIGGAAATSISRPRSRLPAVTMSVLVIAETTALVLTGKVGGPLWFDMVSAASLIVAILAGAEAVVRGPGLMRRFSTPAH